MRWLSATDLVYLAHCILTCVFVDTGYYISVGGRTSSSKALIAYVWIFLTPNWNITSTASDLIIMAMTFYRFLKELGLMRTWFMSYLHVILNRIV